MAEEVHRALMWSWCDRARAVGWWEGMEGIYVPCLGTNHRHGRAGAAHGGSVNHDYRLQQSPTLQVPPIREPMDSPTDPGHVNSPSQNSHTQTRDMRAACNHYRIPTQNLLLFTSALSFKNSLPCSSKKSVRVCERQRDRDLL